jgi:hypothetical protein
MNSYICLSPDNRHQYTAKAKIYEKGQTMIYKTLHKKLKIKLHEPHKKSGRELGCSGRVSRSYFTNFPYINTFVILLVKAQPHRSLAMIGLSGISTYEIQIKINKKKVIPYLCCSIFTEQSSIQKLDMHSCAPEGKAIIQAYYILTVWTFLYSRGQIDRLFSLLGTGTSITSRGYTRCMDSNLTCC